MLWDERDGIIAGELEQRLGHQADLEAFEMQQSSPTTSDDPDLFLRPAQAHLRQPAGPRRRRSERSA
ncbi:MAG: hypothetical protein R2705_04960 [Ilumatobacteraceae bacterium]